MINTDFAVEQHLPVADEDGPVFAVIYRDTDRQEMIQKDHRTEQDAIHCMFSAILYVNLEPVSIGPNIHPENYIY